MMPLVLVLELVVAVMLLAVGILTSLRVPALLLAGKAWADAKARRRQ